MPGRKGWKANVVTAQRRAKRQKKTCVERTKQLVHVSSGWTVFLHRFMGKYTCAFSLNQLEYANVIHVNHIDFSFLYI